MKHTAFLNNDNKETLCRLFHTFSLPIKEKKEKGKL